MLRDILVENVDLLMPLADKPNIIQTITLSLAELSPRYRRCPLTATPFILLPEINNLLINNLLVCFYS